MNAAFTHCVDAKGIVRYLHREVDAMPLRIQRVHVFGEGLPVPANALGQRRSWDVFDAFHQRHQCIAIRAATGREADAAVAGDNSGYAMRHRRKQIGIPGKLTVVVRVQVDKARRDQRAFGIQQPIGGLPGQIPHCDDATSSHGYICPSSRRAGAIDHKSPANQDVV